MKEIVAGVCLLLIMALTAVPGAAMMHGRDDRMHGAPMSRQPREQSRQVEQDQQAGHRHGDYYHTHEGGNLPHNHEENRSIEPGSQDHKTTPSVKAEDSKTTGPQSEQERVEPAEQPQASGQARPAGTVEEAVLPATRQGRDDMVMHLIPGDTFTPPVAFDSSGATEFAVEPFYMDETPVTNHQYVEFLNRVAPDLTVENGVVRGRDGNIWLLLGEVKEGYEPIVYVNGKFVVQGAHHAACAVLRVTAYGADSYARFFGKRLPTEIEWIYAASSGDVNGGAVPPIPSPVMLYPANEYGIRALNSNVGEWALRKAGSADGVETEQQFMVLGGVSRKGGEQAELKAGVRRYPWEAFAQVGFRCVSD